MKVYVIYALRLRGDSEVRYVGMTSVSIEARLRGHISYASNHPIPTIYSAWIVDNWREIEVVKIGQANERTEALALERSMMTAMLALGHRLFNRWGVPRDLRLELRPQDDPRYAERHPKQRIPYWEHCQIGAAA